MITDLASQIKHQHELHDAIFDVHTTSVYYDQINLFASSVENTTCQIKHIHHNGEEELFTILGFAVIDGHVVFHAYGEDDDEYPLYYSATRVGYVMCNNDMSINVLPLIGFTMKVVTYKEYGEV